MFHLKHKRNYYTRTPSVQSDETNGNIDFLQLHPIVAANVLLEISMT
jgi:hypothetical protein